MGTATGQSPATAQLTQVVPAVAAGADQVTALGKAPWACTVTSCTYIADTNLTGADTDSRTFNLIDKGTDGNGTSVIATLAFVDGVNALDFDEKAITLSETAADLDVAEGAVIAWQSLHIGATGLADPGGTVIVVLSRD
jgi:hypothetical protein